jgi:hypothetical protein
MLSKIKPKLSARDKKNHQHLGSQTKNMQLPRALVRCRPGKPGAQVRDLKTGRGENLEEFSGAKWELDAGPVS